YYDLSVGGVATTGTITDVNTLPTIGDDSVAVSEEALTGGIADDTVVGDNSNQYEDNAALASVSGSLAITGNGTAALNVAIDLNTLPTTLQSGGGDITWSYDNNNSAIAVGSTVNGEVIRVELNGGNSAVNSAGSTPPASMGYTVTLSQPVDHPANSLEDTLSFDFDVSISDGANTPIDTGTVSVTIEDDMPSVSSDSNSLTVQINNVEVGGLQTAWTNVEGSASINNQPAGQDDVVSWGRTNQNSNYTFDDNNSLTGTQAVDVNSTFELGTFTHNNFPVRSSIDSVDLNLSLNVVINGYPVQIEHTINFDHNETYNTNDPIASRDIVTIDNASTIVPVSITTAEGVTETYNFQIIGFVDGSGNIVDTVYTNESASNSFKLMAKLMSSDAPEIEGQVDYGFGADGPSDTDAVVWTGMSNGEVQGTYGVLTVDANGNYTYQMDQAAYDALEPGQQSEIFTYTVTDADGDAVTSSLTINITGEAAPQAPDLQPEAVDETVTLEVGAVTTNLVITLDVSGSMDTNISGTGKTRFELAQESLISTIQSYQSMGVTEVNLTLFGASATNIGWMSANDAVEYINSLELHWNDSGYKNGLYADGTLVGVSVGGTDYKDAIDATEVISFTGHSADQTIGYFLSDGQPNDNEDAVNSDNDTTIKDWKDFIEAHVDELHVVGIGSNVSDEYLEHVQVQEGKEPLMVSDETQLAETLTNTAKVTVNGDVTDNYSGGDGAISIDSIEVNGTTYTSSNFPAAGVALDGQGTLIFDFATGEYSYSAQSGEFAEGTTAKAFVVNVSDADGDTASFNVNINVTALDTTASAPNLDGESLVASESVSSTHTVQTVSDSSTTALGSSWDGLPGSKTFVLGGTASEFTLVVSQADDHWDSGEIQLINGSSVVSTINIDGNGTYSAPSGYSFDTVKVVRTGGKFKVSDFSAEVTQTENTYSYELDLSASLTDTDSETLSDVTVSDLPNGVTVTGTGVTDNSNGTFTVALTGGVAASDVKLVSTSQLTQTELDAITISVTATETSSGHENTVTAQLVDGIVEGLAYVTSSGVSGLTDEAGAFSYREGDSVTFMVGNVVIGTASAEDLSAGQVFLQDLADVSRSDLNDEYVENMAVFLQSLDADGNADNGITITPEVLAKFEGVSLDLRTASEAEVKAAIEAAGQNYVTEEEAMAHVQRMLEQHGGQTEFDAHVDDSIVTAILAHEAIEGLHYETTSGFSGELVNGAFTFDEADTINLYAGEQLVASFAAESVGNDGVITFDEAGFNITMNELNELLNPQAEEDTVEFDAESAETSTAQVSVASVVEEIQAESEERDALEESETSETSEEPVSTLESEAAEEVDESVDAEAQQRGRSDESRGRGEEMRAEHSAVHGDRDEQDEDDKADQDDDRGGAS
ncbi:MAG: choice-of-anchor K domain-containing protein, partial [Gammaproteobacteria bacterium]|nr:choice-of-anchor K domain-containing protein [Gammaproteobacteria bacterium]